jgi:hypothetical protein
MAAGAVLAGSLAGLAAIGGQADAAAAGPGPYLTLLFSRTEIAANDTLRPGCVPDTRGIAPLDTMVAPYLARRGMRGTGSLQTGATQQSKQSCLHFWRTTTASWDQATRLQQRYGWQFVSHSATYPASFAGLTMEQKQAETCGSAQTIRDHGLTGAEGLFAWPNNRWNVADQTDIVSTCFAFGRQYGTGGITRVADATTAPYWQHTANIGGGACNDPTQPCAAVQPIGLPNAKYTMPATYIRRLGQLLPGDWLTLQGYILVTGTSPAYTNNPIRWDCTSTDPKLHWTNDIERYCWNDFQAIVKAVPATVTVTDPLTVARAFGRPGF